MPSVSFPTDLYEDLTVHLSRYAEAVAFMLAHESDDGTFRVCGLRLVGGERFRARTSEHCEVDDELRGEVIRWAWDSDCCLIEAHSHGAILTPAEFSRFDMTQLSNWVPHVRWRLGGRPYLALVTASREVDGLAWVGQEPELIEKILVDGSLPIATTGLSFARLRRTRDGSRAL